MTKQQAMEIAALAGVDPRSVDKHARGEPVRRLTRERIEAALVTLRVPHARPPVISRDAKGTKVDGRRVSEKTLARMIARMIAPKKRGSKRT